MRDRSSGGGGLAIGIALGVALAAAMGNVGAGIATGVAVVMGLAAAQRRKSNATLRDKTESTAGPRP